MVCLITLMIISSSRNMFPSKICQHLLCLSSIRTKEQRNSYQFMYHICNLESYWRELNILIVVSFEYGHILKEKRTIRRVCLKVKIIEKINRKTRVRKEKEDGGRAKTKAIIQRPHIHQSPTRLIVVRNGEDLSAETLNLAIKER